MFTWTFWKDALERAFSTAAQAVIGIYFVGDVFTSEIPFTWEAGLTAAGTGFGLTILKSVAASFVGDKESASLDPGA